mmetsp:Transcript_58431/g.167703  ORF Transcript_58431/g.167703 Transcript_58431/m.167703 type:complete len:224 (+) Transcript_58431:2522-3193(+)
MRGRGTPRRWQPRRARHPTGRKARKSHCLQETYLARTQHKQCLSARWHKCRGNPPDSVAGHRSKRRPRGHQRGSDSIESRERPLEQHQSLCKWTPCCRSCKHQNQHPGMSQGGTGNQRRTENRFHPWSYHLSTLCTPNAPGLWHSCPSHNACTQTARRCLGNTLQSKPCKSRTPTLAETVRLHMPGKYVLALGRPSTCSRRSQQRMVNMLRPLHALSQILQKN